MLSDRLVAHRGFQKYYPENTLLSLQKAIEAGAHFVEMDIQFSADHVPVLYHDPMMHRVSNMHQIISNLPLKELTACPAYEPERLGNKFVRELITPLSNVVTLLEQHPKVHAFIELKTEAVEFLGIEKCFEVIHETLLPVADQCILISFHVEFIRFAKQQKFPQTGIVAEDTEVLSSSLIGDLEPEYVFCDKDILPADNLLEFPFLLVVYEVNNADEARLLFDRGADMIETFDIGGLLEQLGHKAI